MSIENTLERIATALEKIAEAKIGQTFIPGTLTETTSEPEKPKTKKQEPKEEEPDDEMEDVSDETEVKTDKEITLEDCRVIGKYMIKNRMKKEWDAALKQLEVTALPEFDGDWKDALKVLEKHAGKTLAELKSE